MACEKSLRLHMRQSSDSSSGYLLVLVQLLAPRLASAHPEVTAMGKVALAGSESEIKMHCMMSFPSGLVVDRQNKTNKNTELVPRLIMNVNACLDTFTVTEHGLLVSSLQGTVFTDGLQ
jgi:hypothetical protein